MYGSVALLSAAAGAGSLGSSSLAGAKAAARARPRSGLQKQVLGLYRRYVRAIREKELPEETKLQIGQHVREQVGARSQLDPSFLSLCGCSVRVVCAVCLLACLPACLPACLLLACVPAWLR